MSDHVDALLKNWRTSSFEWGKTDCMLSVGDYIASRGGLDVASEFRGRYNDEAGALHHMQAAGGPAALIDRTGVPRAAEPKRGDAVVINIGAMTVAGVYTGDGVAVRRERGVAEIATRFIHILAAWSVL